MGMTTVRAGVRCRVRAAALALLFAATALLPWLHLLGLAGHEGHRCCDHGHAASGTARQERTPGDLPELLDSRGPADAEVCGLCQILAKLAPYEGAEAACRCAFAAQAHEAPARWTEAPALRTLGRANRAQAPPAAV